MTVKVMITIYGDTDLMNLDRWRKVSLSKILILYLKDGGNNNNLWIERFELFEKHGKVIYNRKDKEEVKKEVEDKSMKFFSDFLALQFQIDDKKTKLNEMKSICNKYIRCGIKEIHCENIHVEGTQNIICVNEDCSICLDEFNECTVRLNCRHQFHFKCFDDMIGNKISSIICPNCRQEVTSLFIYAYNLNLPQSHDTYEAKKHNNFMIIYDDLSDGSMLSKLKIQHKKEIEKNRNDYMHRETPLPSYNFGNYNYTPSYMFNYSYFNPNSYSYS